MGRHTALAGVVAGLGLVATVLAAAAGPPRLSFQMATGSTAGTYFPMGELIAGIVSHPPDLARCEAPGVCGPAGLIVSARTSDGAVANVLAVNDRLVDSGLAQSNVVADALAGKGAFQARQSHIRVIASLFSETVQLVVAAKSDIIKVADLKGKRVSLGTDGSGASVVAHEILAAYGLAENQLKLRRLTYDRSATLLNWGEIDGFFFEGAAPAPLVADLLARGKARLIPIDGRARRRLLSRVPSLAPDTIRADAYAASGTIQTVSSRTLWIVHDSAPPDIVYGIVRALFHPANRALLDAGGAHIRLGEATNGLTAPLHPGAERFYREQGMFSHPKTPAHK